MTDPVRDLRPMREQLLDWAFLPVNDLKGLKKEDIRKLAEEKLAELMNENAILKSELDVANRASSNKDERISELKEELGHEQQRLKKLIKLRAFVEESLDIDEQTAKMLWNAFRTLGMNGVPDPDFVLMAGTLASSLNFRLEQLLTVMRKASR